MKNYQCLYVKKIFIGIIYALECKLNPCFNGIRKYNFTDSLITLSQIRLNPCSNGILKYSVSGDKEIVYTQSLNPCSNGILKYATRVQD